MALGTGRIAEADFIGVTLPGDGYDPITAVFSRNATACSGATGIRWGGS
jgi:hypothetical protein